MKHVGNALKVREKFWWNKQIITACPAKVDYFELNMNEELNMIVPNELCPYSNKFSR